MSIEFVDQSEFLADKLFEQTRVQMERLFRIGWSENKVHGAYNSYFDNCGYDMVFDHSPDDQEYMEGYNCGLEYVENIKDEIFKLRQGKN